MAKRWRMVPGLEARYGPNVTAWKLIGFHARGSGYSPSHAGNRWRHDGLRDMDCRSSATVEWVVSMTKATARGKYDRSLTTEQRAEERMEKLLDIATDV